MTTQQKGNFFQMAMGVMQALIVAAMVWVGSTSLETKVAIAQMEVKIESLTNQTSARYTSRDADADWRHQNLIDQQQAEAIRAASERYNQWTTRLSDRLSTVEKILQDQGYTK